MLYERGRCNALLALHMLCASSLCLSGCLNIHKHFFLIMFGVIDPYKQNNCKPNHNRFTVVYPSELSLSWILEISSQRNVL